MPSYRQEPPFAVQVELAEGCPIACSFCALQSIRDNGADWSTGKHGKNSAPYKFMSVDTAENLAAELAEVVADHGWNPRVEFAMHGEGSMNPDFVEIVRIFRKELPTTPLMMTSNGAGFVKPENLVAVFEAGLNVLALDDYKHADLVNRVVENLQKDPKVQEDLDRLLTGDAIHYYPEEPKGNPHRRVGVKEHFITVVKDITEAEVGTHSNVTNQGGSSGAHDLSMKHARCAKPFRELSVRWDGNVAICCDDWPGYYKIGNVFDAGLDALWNHPRFYAARQKLLHGERDFGPCLGCNVRSYRTGLLPDKFGKETLPEPDARTSKIIQEALAGDPFTTPIVKRRH